MPIYEYRCVACELEFERMQKVSASSPDCPQCGGATSRRVSLSAFHLKGSGWYTSDYKRSSASSATGGASTEGAGGDGAPAAASAAGGGDDASV